MSLPSCTGSSLSDWTLPSFWASSLRLDLPCQTGPLLHSGPPPSDWPSPARLDPCSPFWGLLSQTRPPLPDWNPHCPSFWASSLRRDLPCQTGSCPLHSWPSPLRLHLPLQTGFPHFFLGLPPQTGPPLHSGSPPSDWTSLLRLDTRFILCFLPPTGPPPSDWIPLSFQASAPRLGLT